MPQVEDFLRKSQGRQIRAQRGRRHGRRGKRLYIVPTVRLLFCIVATWSGDQAGAGAGTASLNRIGLANDRTRDVYSASPCSESVACNLIILVVLRPSDALQVKKWQNNSG